MKRGEDKLIRKKGRGEGKVKIVWKRRELRKRRRRRGKEEKKEK